MRTRIVRSGVLVIGGGLAGIQAALAARRSGASVCLVLKGKLGSSGNTAVAGGGVAAALGLADPTDSVDAHFADTMAGGCNVNNSALVRTMVERAPEAVLELHRMGVNFARSGDGLAQYRTPAQSHPRALRTEGGGAAQTMAVLAEALDRTGVQLIEGVMMLDLLSDGGAAIGAIGFSPSEEAMVAFETRAVVLACGGAGQLFPLTTNHPEATGDGYAMAYRAGARLADMEFVQFTPTALAYPLELRGVSAGGSLLGQEKARLLNRFGERFMERYDPQRMEQATRAITARAIYREIAEGRGTEYGAVYLDVTRVDPGALETISGPLMQRIRAYGVEPLAEPMEVAPAVHHYMGGVAIDSRCRSSIPGLFAAGEVAAGVHGANRLNSNGLSEAAVFGTIAGEEAAAHAGATAPVAPEEEALARARSELEMLLLSGLPAEPLLAKLRMVMLSGAGMERRAPDVEAALSDLEGLSVEAGDVGAAGPEDLPRVIELRNMLRVGEIVLRAILARTESRGAHFRVDFPQQDDERWLANVVVARGESGPVLEVVPIRGEAAGQ